VNAFLPARYELEQHQTTRFPLDGAHTAVACRGCHPSDEGLAGRLPVAVSRRLKAHHRPERISLTVLHPKKAPQACNGCHDDVHRGQFGTKAAGGVDNCVQCHKTTSFADLSFDHDKDSRFPLTGKHAQTRCAGCHRPTRVGNQPPFVRYRPLERACTGCHADYHQGQFLASSIDVTRDDDGPSSPGAAGTAAGAGARGCDFCHKTTRFKDSLFVHNEPRFSSYPLEGKHAQVACARCHPTVRPASDVVTVRYRPLPRACEGCHADFHHGEFRGFEP
jgi:hypothetical protein